MSGGSSRSAVSRSGWQAFRPGDNGRVDPRWRWLAAAWLIFLLTPVSACIDRTDGWATVAGVLLVVAFAAIYLSVLGMRHRGNRTLALAIPWVLLAIALVLLPLTGESGLTCFVFVAVSFLAVYPLVVSIPMTLLLVLLALVLPYRVPGWSRDGAGQALSILLAAAVVLAMVQLLRSNRALVHARQELAELAVVEERERFARDLHDILGHSLTVITKKAELARRLTPVDPERAAAEIADVERLAREALQDVRATVTGIRQVSLASELASARQALEAAGIRADLPYSVEDVPPQYRELFGWAVREAVTNVVRHSGATSCRITVHASTLEVVDDGRGPAPAGGASGAAGGHGLVGLSERVRAAGGTLRTGDAPAGGFRLWVGVPLLPSGADSLAPAEPAVP
jgi:two-component system, NarL family, sensor histidine kinase DesK